MLPWSCRSRFMLAAAPSSDAPLLLRRLCPCDKPWDKPERGVFSLSLHLSSHLCRLQPVSLPPPSSLRLQAP